MNALPRKSESVHAQFEAGWEREAWHSHEEQRQHALSEPAVSGRPKDRPNTVGPGADVLSRNVEVTGTIKFTSELIIDGKVEGEIFSDGVLLVGANADIRGEIKTRSVTVLGRVTGGITAADRCELKAGAHLAGDLRAGRLVMEDGATFVGTSEVPLEKDAASAAAS
jgi:cytoskeletal protein CcmA (bactofilin family)